MKADVHRCTHRVPCKAAMLSVVLQGLHREIYWMLLKAALVAVLVLYTPAEIQVCSEFWFSQTKLKYSRSDSLFFSFSLLISGCGGVFQMLCGFVKHIKYH